ncbi:mechanosensitive ion channel family protein [Niabella ginsengisoli]|uniref:Mechanosensitive ion channel n=1 Tax=Niabella ginsengisoli TaxID=522298 RepID=A0ABS9SIJ7_9BACT|nr:mechanosensitive ion channel domain-containing protein [Niabella ginsengisoli]MCH5598131.1 mechanosensitive ion channel [Niabella ginsengisoli]
MILLQLENATNQASYLLAKAKDMAIEYAPKLIGAILIYLVGSWIIKKLSGAIERMLTRHNYDPSLKTFLSSLLRGLLTVLLLLAVFQKIGMEITSFAAILAGVGLGIGAALNGSMGNFAGGVMMLLFKPFKVGDLIEAQTQIGTVLEQGIFNTIILTPDNKTVILPNGPLSTGTISNYTTHGNLRVDVKMLSRWI